jgi:hypothetical protein
MAPPPVLPVIIKSRNPSLLISPKATLPPKTAIKGVPMISLKLPSPSLLYKVVFTGPPLPVAIKSRSPSLSMSPTAIEPASAY